MPSQLLWYFLPQDRRISNNRVAREGEPLTFEGDFRFCDVGYGGTLTAEPAFYRHCRRPSLEGPDDWRNVPEPQRWREHFTACLMRREEDLAARRGGYPAPVTPLHIVDASEILRLWGLWCSRHFDYGHSLPWDLKRLLDQIPSERRKWYSNEVDKLSAPERRTPPLIGHDDYLRNLQLELMLLDAMGATEEERAVCAQNREEVLSVYLKYVTTT